MDSDLKKGPLGKTVSFDQDTNMKASADKKFGGDYSSIMRESRIEESKQEVEYDPMDPYASSIKKRRPESDYHQDSLKSLIDEFLLDNDIEEKSKFKPK